MYSLNVPVPATVATVASQLARELPGSNPRPRGEHTLGVKRLGDGTETPYSRLEARVRELLTGHPPFEAQIDDVRYFDEVPRGAAPVVYLAVDSPVLVELHERLSQSFDPVDGIEGENYVPHVTVARGGSPELAARLAEQSIDPITWQVTELVFWDAAHSQPVSRLSLPA